MKNPKILLFIILLAFVSFCSHQKEISSEAIIGSWKMEIIKQDGNDVSREHNPFNERTVLFYEDGSFVSDGRPYGKNTGRWTLSESTGELFLDSDAGEGDDSYWIVTFINRDKMKWRGTRSDFTERFELIHSRKE